LNGILSGQSAEQIAYNVVVAGAIGAVAGLAGGAAAEFFLPVAEGLVGTLGLTCENDLGAVGAFVIGGTNGAAFGVASSFVRVGLTTFNLGQAIDAAGQGAVMGGAIGGTVAVGVNAISEFVCFPAGVPVPTPEGDKLIECLKRDDQILSRDEARPDGPVEAKRIEEVFVREGVIFELTVAGRSIRTTAEHPFYVKDGGWTPASNLVPGNLLATLDGRWLPLESARHGRPRDRLQSACR
jgi:hypothetical protein